MEWLPLTDAASRLGISARTLQRRIKKGLLDSTCDAKGRTLVMVDDAGPTLADSTRHLAEAAKATAIARDVDQRQLSAILSLCEKADHRVERAFRLSIAVCALAAIVVVSVSLAYYRQGVTTVRQVTGLEFSLHASKQQATEYKRQVTDGEVEADRLHRNLVDANTQVETLGRDLDDSQAEADLLRRQLQDRSPIATLWRLAYGQP